jgi:hypothetical protein
MKKGIVILICLALGFLAIATQISVSAAVVENSDVPVWEVGDQWCMGYEDTLDESDMDDEFGNEFFEPSKLVFDGKMGYYRALTVEDDDAVVTVGETDYTCYDVYYEEYIAMSVRMEVAMSIDFADIMEQFGSEFDTSEVDLSAYEDMSMSMMMSGYMWYDLEITGHIFYTVEDLAVAKGSFDFLLNSDVNYLYDVSYSGELFEGMFEDEYDYSTRAQTNGDTYDDYPEENTKVSSDETRMYYTIKQTITDWSASYDILYNPPLNLFDFPIYQYDDWETYSEMTIILNHLSGTISYDMMMDDGYGTPESDKGTNVIGEGMSFPQTYGPESVDYSFRCSDIEYKRDTDGTETECYLIEPDYWYYWDYYEDESMSNYWDVGAYMSMDMEDPSVIGSEEIEGYDQANPIDMMARSENWYSFDSSNFVAALPPEAEESDMFGGEEGELEAQTYSEVTTFNEITRNDIKADYEDYKASSKDSSSGDDDAGWLFWVFIIAIIVVVILIAVIFVWTRNRKRQQAYYQQPQQPYPQNQPQAQYQPPGDRGIRVAEQAPPNQGPQAPKIVRQPKIVNNQAPPQPQPVQQPYYPPPQQQQQPYYPPPQQQNQYPPPPSY